MRSRNDVLITLNQSDSLAEKLVHLHQVVRDLHPQITRVSIALYDKATDKVRTFTYSGKETPLNHYQSTLSKCHSLNQLAEIRVLSGQRIDPDCANALMGNLDEVLEIREAFQDADQ